MIDLGRAIRKAGAAQEGWIAQRYNSGEKNKVRGRGWVSALFVTFPGVSHIKN